MHAIGAFISHQSQGHGARTEGLQSAESAVPAVRPERSFALLPQMLLFSNE